MDMAENGFRLYAAEKVETREFIGFIGLARPTFETAFTPAVEIGWRLVRQAWGQGYAAEGARAVVSQAFGQLRLRSLVSFTSAVNHRTRRVMERNGMTHDPIADFMHPNLPVGHPLSAHVLYRMVEPRLHVANR
jgi:RimJ/RimL family protein N-acetyltransferase